MEAAEILRIKREECKQTKHDSQFSNWKFLVGPSDWEDHSLGKEGVDKYRVHNLPTTSGPGVYELGISVRRPGSGRSADKLDSDDVVVVYLGQADSVRTRLQCYGRSGAHLNNANGGPGCFDDTFGRCYSIVYRWAPMKNKADALKTESKLLETFDYAWNKGSNGTRRQDDVLQELNKAASKTIQLPKTVRKLLYISQKPAGIKIRASKLPPQQNKSSTYADEESHSFFSQIFKHTKSQPRLVCDRHGADEDQTGICGVVLADSSVCRRPPVEGRKRCAQHRGMKISASISTLTIEGKSQVGNADQLKLPMVVQKCPINEDINFICGVILDDGSLCRRPPVQGNKRCEKHKWRKICGSDSKLIGTSKNVHDVPFDSSAHGTLSSPKMYQPGKVQPQGFSEGSTANLQYDTICGVEFGDGTFCTRQAVKGRKRCEEHKGLKISRINSKSAAQDKAHVYDMGTNSFTSDDQKYSRSVCGGYTADGSYCSRPVNGNTRCWQHSGRVFDTGLTTSKCKDRNGDQNYSSGVCGAPTLDGSYCCRPVNGNTRCWQHSGRVFDTGLTTSKCNDRNGDQNYSSGVCGAPTLDGSYCRRAVNGNTRCWQHSQHVLGSGSTISKCYDWDYGGTSVCGAPTRNGSYCKRAVKGGGRCWQH